MYIKPTHILLLLIAFISFGATSNKINDDVVNLCSYDNFEQYTQAFFHSKQLQEKYTIFPLQYLYVDPTGNPDPLDITTKKHDWDDTLQIMLSPSAIRGLDTRHKSQTNTFTFVVTKPNTGHLVEYHFKKMDCWYLYSIENWSM
ncbi:hypothetical protein C2869_06650 [Saccharobesus litoralis]|uniref:DUF4348 domain-containing protein n=1 Tax=Saccharobesus litoralis TaxID=2172099 RepID=A0A2S0VPJ4_9ALTE|nr:hypothetical protein [Saccharobesus litoralis]AWB66138.1 hypothetical protein C2869_06650 [Saccharobesus litoralis]